MLRYVAVCALVAVTFAQDFDFAALAAPRPAPAKVKPNYSGPSKPAPTPVPILKQIDRQNEDGSYTYGYESADGSFKIETKLPTGEVKGKYGYVDDVGKIRVIEYGATKYGFEPAGEGITIPPPTLVDETTDKHGNLLPEYADEDPAPAPPPRAHSPLSSLSRAQPSSSFEYSGPQTFEPVQKSSAVPVRASIAGAAPSPAISFPSASRASFAPAPSPVKTASTYSVQPSPLDDFGSSLAKPAPKITYAQPAPVARPQPQTFAPAPRPAPRPAAPAPQYRPAPAPAASPFGRSADGESILDKLSREYALPQNSNTSPSHDISFGYI